MPVPVPRISKPVAHPVIKHNDKQRNQPISFNIASSLPVSPSGRPPSFGTREHCIDSLPSWRRTKPRRIWENDSLLALPVKKSFQGLTAADNASVIKGARAQARFPPFAAIFDSLDPLEAAISINSNSHEAFSESAGVDSGVHIPDQMRSDQVRRRWSQASYRRSSSDQTNFPPPFEIDSPEKSNGPGSASSPIEPVTPFGEFVDRAVATALTFPALDTVYPSLHHSQVNQLPQCEQKAIICDHSQTVTQLPKEPVPAPAVADVVTPTATPSYRKLAESLSEWIANYVWKVCTTGLSLPPMFSQTSLVANAHSTSPPSYLAGAVHSLLLSTLLQPSAVFLAIWYIVRLPIYFNAVALSAEYIKEIHFRAALLGENHSALSGEGREGSAPFRLIVLGCMLANKWLDDHTFSNKTWHTISNVPVHTLNTLESLALSIFSYDLSIASTEWSRWLSHLLSYHISLSSTTQPQPISRPSTNPQLIIRRAIEEIIQASTDCGSSKHVPIFVGLEDRRREKIEKQQVSVIGIDIDLDEDGPLREEYLPKRRVSGASSIRGAGDATLTNQGHPFAHYGDDKSLPPPARWSPAADEPIHPERSRASGHYVAVQPPLIPTIAAFPVLPTYPYMHDVPYASQSWVGGTGFVQTKLSGYIPALNPIPHTAYNPYPFILPVPLPHSRSQSFSFDQDNSHNHIRSSSQTQFEYRYSDIRMTAHELPTPQHTDCSWAAAPGHYSHLPDAYAAHPGVTCQSTWLST